jgi:uncharacterized protein (TIGR02001 family)
MSMHHHRKIFRLNGMLCFCTSLCLILLSIAGQAQQRTDPKNTSNKLFGEAGIESNYVEHGVTQSDKGPALQLGLGYQMGPQARLGFWGSSVKYSDDSANINLRPYVDVKMDFTSNTNLVLGYEFNRYFSSDTRNGTLLRLDLASFNYHGLVQINSNWEGTASSATWFGFRKEFMLPKSFILTPTLGFTQLSATGYSSYFDTRVSIGYKFADILYELVNTWNSNSSQFNGRGDMAFLFSMNARV